jgi:CotH protein
MRFAQLVCLSSLLVACSGGGGAGDAGGIDAGSHADAGPSPPDGQVVNSQCPTDFIASAPFVPCELPAGVTPTAGADPGSDSIFDPAKLLLYEIAIPDDQWQTLCTNARDNAAAILAGGQTESAFVPTWARARVRVGGEAVDCVGLRIRGRTTIKKLFYQDSSDVDPDPEYQDCLMSRFAYKPSFKVGMSSFVKGQRFHEQKHISLGGREGGDSQFHDYLAAQLAARFGVPGVRVSHGLLCINGVYRGVFAVQEEVDDQAFLDYHFADAPDGNYYQAKWAPLTFYSSHDLEKYRRDSYSTAAGTGQDALGADLPYTDQTDLIRLLRFASFRDPALFAAEVGGVAAVDAWLRVIAMETTLSDTEGMFPYARNVALYNHPGKGWWPVRHDWDQAFRDGPSAVPVAGRERLFDLAPNYSLPDNNPPNRCDGRPVVTNTDCPGLCSERSVRHPVLATRLLFARRADYLDRVEEFLNDVFVPADIEAMIAERRTLLDAAYVGDPWTPYANWDTDVTNLLADVPRLHADALAALQDARDNPFGLAPVAERDQMIQWCGQRSCWPYACP